MRSGLALLLAGGLIFAWLESPPPRAAGAGPGAPQAIILMIGDGMGLPQLALARLVNGGPLKLEGLRELGLVRTASADSPVTDSAAAATAISTGHKTGLHRLGVDAEGRPLRGLAQRLGSRGWRIGVVSNTRLTHATPAAFLARSDDRHKEHQIAEQLVSSGAFLMLGGGARHFGAELRGRCEQAGYAIVPDAAGLAAHAGGPLLGLFASSHMDFEIDRPAAQPSLAEMTRWALRLMSAERPHRPFFLMIEGGMIDQAGHDHDAATIASEVLAFDAAVAEVLAFMDTRKRALLLITADHGNGALGISERIDVAGLRATVASARRMGNELRGGADPRELLQRNAGLAELSDEELAPLRAAARGPDDYRVWMETGDLMSRRRGVFFYPLTEQYRMPQTHGHDGTDVAIFAQGPGAERFAGLMENSEIPRRLMALMGLEEARHVGE